MSRTSRRRALIRQAEREEARAAAQLAQEQEEITLRREKLARARLEIRSRQPFSISGTATTAVYYRVSTKRQDFDVQKATCEAWLEKENRFSFVTYEDFGKSGAETSRRRGFQDLMRDCRDGKVSAVVVYRLDRLSRNAVTAIQTVLELEKLGVEFFAVTQPALCLGKEMPFRKTLLAAFAEIAQIERETIVQRISDGVATARARGVKLGRPPALTQRKLQEICALADEKRYSLQEMSERTGVNVCSLHKILTGKSYYGPEWARAWRKDQKLLPALPEMRKKPVIWEPKLSEEKPLRARLPVDVEIPELETEDDIDTMVPQREDTRYMDEWDW